MTRFLLASALTFLLACGDDGAPTVDAGYDAALDAPSGDAGADAADTCSDERQNGGESDTDCGGPCDACLLDQRCFEDTDCASEVCSAEGRCITATCADGLRDGSETDVDCGGPCDGCAAGQGCGRALDCASGICADGTCRPESCDDGVRGGDETDVDCGGSCGACGVGDSCRAAEDCASLACRGVGVCRDGCFAAFGLECGDLMPTFIDDPHVDDLFGYRLAASGELLAIGSIRESGSAGGIDGDRDARGTPGAGAVFVYRRSGAGAWQLEAYIKAAAPQQSDLFGFGLALADDVLVVGAPGRDDDDGAAFVFRRGSTGTWSQEATLAREGPEQNEFGRAVAVNGDWAIVGAPDTGSDVDASGQAFVFRRSGGGWSHTATLAPTRDDLDSTFGHSLSMSDTLLAVGAPGNRSGDFRIDGEEAVGGSPSSGAVYVFRLEGETWSRDVFLKADNGSALDRLGWSVSLRGDDVLVGARDAGLGTTEPTGGAYLFHRDPIAGWSQQLFVRPRVSDERDNFGTEVALGDGWFAVHSPNEDGAGPLTEGDPRTNSVTQSGAVYIYRDLGSLGWRQVLYLKSPAPGEGDLFGQGLAIADDDVLLVGAPHEDSGDQANPADDSARDSGGVFVFDARPSMSTAEVCDGFDNDLDDSIDETFAECGGACVEGLCE